MATFADMLEDLQLIVVGRLDDATLDSLINRAQQQIAEAWDWSFLHAQAVVNSVAPEVGGQITLTQGFPQVLGAGTAFTAMDAGSFLWAAGVNLAPIPVASVQGPASLTLISPWPGATQVLTNYILAPLYYLVSNALQVRSVRSIIKLDYVTREALNDADPARIAQGAAPALKWTDAPPSPDGSLQIELWPVPADARTYLCDIKQKPPVLVNDSDLPLVPYAVIEAKAAYAGCQALYASTGRRQWLDLAGTYAQLYQKEFDEVMAADRQRLSDRSQVTSPSLGTILQDSGFVPTHDLC